MLSLCAGIIVSNISSEGLSELERDILNLGFMNQLLRQSRNSLELSEKHYMCVHFSGMRMQNFCQIFIV